MDLIEAKAKEKGYSIITLTVVSAYLPAINLYKKKGFRKYGLFPLKPNTCHMIEMEKT